MKGAFVAGPAKWPRSANGMHDGNDELGGRTHDPADFPQCAGNIVDVHQDVVGDDEIELRVCEWQCGCGGDSVVAGGTTLRGGGGERGTGSVAVT